MEITLFGWFILAVILIVLLTKKINYLLYLAVFFSGFTGTSVLNVSDFSLQPAFALFIAYFIFTFFNGKFKLRIDKSLLLFVVYCTISIIFPVFLSSSNIRLMNQDAEYTTLKFTFSNITQLMYLILDILFLNTLYKSVNNDKVRKNIIKSFKYGLLAVNLVCYYQILAFALNLEFDAFFRQSVHGNIQGRRIYGPCIEASMLSYYLISAVVIVWLERKAILDYIVILSSLFLGVLSYSSTFILGFGILSIICLVCIFKRMLKSNSSKFWFACLAGLVLIIIGCIVLSDKIIYAIDQLLEKLKLGNISGAERFETFVTMSAIGLKYPLGVGFGSSRSKDLLSTWLCNVGIVGVLIFCRFIYKWAKNVKKKNGLVYALPFILVFFVMCVSVAEPYNFFIWFYLFYGICAHDKKKERIGKTVKNANFNKLAQCKNKNTI